MATLDMTPADWMTLVTERAPALRRAGVTTIELAGCVLDLAPWDAPSVGDAPAARAESSTSDPLFDPATYHDGRVPGFDIEAVTPADGDVEGRR